MAVALLRSNLMICEGTGCAASQAHDIRAALSAEIKRRGLDGEVRIGVGADASSAARAASRAVGNEVRVSSARPG